MSVIDSSRDTQRLTSATDELRRLLDERGVEWTASDGMYVKETRWPYMGELTAVFAEYYDGTTGFACDTWCFTPAQAIAATLGATDARPTQAESSGTCRDKNGFDPDMGFECTVCGAMTDGYMLSTADMGHYKQFNFCPMCGRRIVQ